MDFDSSLTSFPHEDSILLRHFGGRVVHHKYLKFGLINYSRRSLFDMTGYKTNDAKRPIKNKNDVPVTIYIYIYIYMYLNNLNKEYIIIHSELSPLNRDCWREGFRGI